MVDVLKPQPGPQTKFAKCPADIVIFGGAAGGGKSAALLLEALRHINNKDYEGLLLRRESHQIRSVGGLWQTSLKLFSGLGEPREGKPEWIFPSGAKINFGHIHYESDVLKYKGAQIPYLAFDEITEFTKKQFLYMLSRNRSTCGIKSYIRASCNPEPGSWLLKDFLDWWIGDDGFPIEDRDGVIRWFINRDDKIIWADTKKELTDLYVDEEPLSFTFIKSKVQDNKILLNSDKGYLSKLKALDKYNRQLLLDGNWKVSQVKGIYFKRSYFKIVNVAPSGGKVVRYWDRAATIPNPKNPDPDYTVGLRMKQYKGDYYIEHIERLRDSPNGVRQAIKRMADQDGRSVNIRIEQEPGSSGVADANDIIKLLAGYKIKAIRSTGDKITRAEGISAQAEAGNVYIVKGVWNDDFLDEVENFYEKSSYHDDQVDAMSGAFNYLTSKPKLGIYTVSV